MRICRHRPGLGGGAEGPDWLIPVLEHVMEDDSSHYGILFPNCQFLHFRKDASFRLSSQAPTGIDIKSFCRGSSQKLNDPVLTRDLCGSSALCPSCEEVEPFFIVTSRGHRGASNPLELGSWDCRCRRRLYPVAPSVESEQCGDDPIRDIVRFIVAARERALNLRHGGGR